MLTRITRRPTVASDAINEKRTEFIYWWLLVAIFFEYARPDSFVSGIRVAKLNSLIPLSLLVVTLFAGGLRPFEQIFANRQARWLLAFLCLIVLSVPFADVSLYSVNIFKAALGYFFLFLIVARVATSLRRLRGIFATLIVAHLFLMAMTPAIVLNPQQRTYIAGGTFLGDGNDFALSLCILLPLAFELAAGTKSRIVAAISLGALLAILLAIVGTQSRGATLGMIAVGGFLWFFSNRKAASSVVLVLCALVVSFHASDAYFTRMSTIKNYQGEGSAEGRITAWKAGVRMALHDPLFGVGSGNFPTAFGSNYRPAGWDGPLMTAHSSYFLVLGELGLPGFITMLSLVVGGAVSTMALRRRVLGSSTDPPSEAARDMARMLQLLTASLIGFGVAGAFLSASYYPHIFVLSGLLVSAHSIALTGVPVALHPSRPGDRGMRSKLRKAEGSPVRKARAGDKETPDVRSPRNRAR